MLSAIPTNRSTSIPVLRITRISFEQRIPRRKGALASHLSHLHSPPTLIHLVYMPRHERIHGHVVKQQQFTNKCFGCGPDSEGGLKLKFVLDKDRQRFVCRFRL